MSLENIVSEGFTEELADAVRSAEIKATFPFSKQDQLKLADELQRSVYQPEVEQLYRKALESPLGRKLSEWLDARRYASGDVDYFTYLDIDNAKAVTLRISTPNGYVTVLGINKKLKPYVEGFDLSNPLNVKQYFNSYMMLLTMLHEYVHARGEFSEKKTNTILKDLFSEAANELKSKAATEAEVLKYKVLNVLAKISGEKAKVPDYST